LLSAAQIEGWFKSTGATANITVPFTWLVSDYMKAGKLTGVRADVAFAQSVVETGYFSFPGWGQDKRGYNNFAGIGACDTCKHGWKFPTPMAGVLAQETLLGEYATPQLSRTHQGSMAGVGVQGCCSTWIRLSGVWASNPNYGYEILAIYKEMFDWALQGDLRNVGLAGKVAVAASAIPLPSPAPAPTTPATSTTTGPATTTSPATSTAPTTTPPAAGTSASQPGKSSPTPSRSPPT
jgi:hypothetical protein